ncbi:MAG: replication initiator protein [Microviridae sp.]|nr:MAG: replication initiator protein [Microviridae sp.]
MPCYKPLQGYRAASINPKTGKRPVVFTTKGAFIDMPVTVPCGACIGCRLERSRQWALRCVHEAKFHELSSFLTLTYDDEHLPADGSLDHRHFQLFMKRLRKFHHGKIKFFMCGEYGDTTRRPHYHAIVYGIDFADKVRHSKNEHGDTLYRSDTLTNLWQLGHAWLGNVSYRSAAYVARYSLKKVTGEKAKEHYQNLDTGTGEIFQIRPEYIAVSKGFGLRWFEAYKSDCYPSDFLTHEGRKFSVPKYYDKLLERTDPKALQRYKARRISRSKRNQADQTPERLAVREVFKKSQIQTLKRKI